MGCKDQLPEGKLAPPWRPGLALSFLNCKGEQKSYVIQTADGNTRGD